MESARRNMIQVDLDGKPSSTQSLLVTVHPSIICSRPLKVLESLLVKRCVRYWKLPVLQNVLAKCYGSTNPVNVIRATFEGLKRHARLKAWLRSAAKLLKKFYGKYHGGQDKSNPDASPIGRLKSWPKPAWQGLVCARFVRLLK